MSDVTNAKVVGTHNPKDTEFIAHYVVETLCASGSEVWFASKSEISLAITDPAEAERVAAWQSERGKRARVLRLPSESETALAPLVDEYHKAAVELAEAECAISDNDIAVMRGNAGKPEAYLLGNRDSAEQKYRAAKAALEAAKQMYTANQQSNNAESHLIPPCIPCPPW